MFSKIVALDLSLPHDNSRPTSVEPTPANNKIKRVLPETALLRDSETSLLIESADYETKDKVMLQLPKPRLKVGRAQSCKPRMIKPLTK